MDLIENYQELTITRLKQLPPVGKHEMKNCKYIIYVFINLINNKMYFGQTNNCFSNRYHLENQYWSTDASNDHFKRSLNKYKAINFKIVILHCEECEKRLNELEVYYIQKFKTNNMHFGYNKTNGGKSSYKFNKEIINNKYYSQEEFIQKSQVIHLNRYDYSGAEYKGVFNKLKIICPVHGEFWQSPHSHWRGEGCKLCGIERMKLKQGKSFERFINEANKKHNNAYIYYKEGYGNNKTKIKMIHIKCNNDFYQSPNSHLRGDGCLHCRKIADITRCLGRSRSVIMMDLEGKIINKFHSIADAARFLNKKTGSLISRICQNDNNQMAYGYKWKYVED